MFDCVVSITVNVWPYVLLISSRFCGGDNYRRDSWRYPPSMPVTLLALITKLLVLPHFLLSCFARIGTYVAQEPRR